MIVLDASAVLEVLLRTQAAAAVEARIFAQGATLHAPHLLDVEVAQVLQRYATNKVTTSARARRALADFLDFPIERYSHTVFLERIWALRHQVTAYDATYVVLAETLDAPLLTCDGHLAHSHGHRARIDFLPGSPSS